MNSRMFWNWVLWIVLTVCMVNVCQSQELEQVLAEKQRIVSLAELINDETSLLDDRLSRSLAKTEVADSIWPLERTMASNLLIEAMRLTFPTPDEKKSLESEITAGFRAPSKLDLARRNLRNRIFRISSQDSQLLDIIGNILEREVGKEEKVQNSLRLAAEQARSGNVLETSANVSSAVASGQLNLNVGQVIFAIASQDRAAADALILDVINQLRLQSLNKQEFAVMVAGLDLAVYGEMPVFLGQVRVPPADSLVIVAYLDFQLDKIIEIGQFLPLGLQEMRGNITSLWPRISVFAPELTQRFQLLEAQSRLSPSDTTMPNPPSSDRQADRDKDIYETARKTKMDKDIDLAVRLAILRKDFSLARELADLYRSKEIKQASLDRINFSEVKFLIEAGTVERTERIAAEIVSERLLIEVYGLLINAYLSEKNFDAARESLETAKKRITFADSESSFLHFSRFVVTVSKIDKVIAQDLLIELVRRLNLDEQPTETTRARFDSQLFASLVADLHESLEIDKIRQIALMIKNPLDRIIAVASVNKVEAESISKVINKLDLNLP